MNEQKRLVDDAVATVISVQILLVDKRCQATEQALRSRLNTWLVQYLLAGGIAMAGRIYGTVTMHKSVRPLKQRKSLGSRQVR